MGALELIGGPYDGAAGPFNVKASRLWVRPDVRRRGLNGLLLSTRPHPGAACYARGWSNGLVARFVFDGVDAGSLTAQFEEFSA
jgi:hypothetical protein